MLFILAPDAFGIGVILPILPALLRDVTQHQDVAGLMGLLAALQCVFAPALGSLRDRFGRRRVLLTSLAGVVASYGVLALAPNIALLLLGAPSPA